MESIGSPRFFATHSATVRAVAFSPKDRFLFASGGNDGNICLYHAGRAELLNMFPVTTSPSRHVYSLKYTCDGRRILAVTTTRRLSVLDVERGHLVSSYENCAYNGRDRAALATDPSSPDMAVCAYVNGKGLTMFDLRMPLPNNFYFDFHCDTIRDIQYLDGSWPFAKSAQNSNGASPIGQSAASASTIMTLSSAGVTKICTVDGTVLHAFDFGQCANSIVATPEPFGSAASEGFTSAILAGGTLISSYAPTPNGVNGNGYGVVQSPGPTVMTTSAGMPIPFTEDVGIVSGTGGHEFYGFPLQMVAQGVLPRSSSSITGGGGILVPHGNHHHHPPPHIIRGGSSGSYFMEQDPSVPPGPEAALNDPRVQPQQQPPLPPSIQRRNDQQLFFAQEGGVRIRSLGNGSASGSSNIIVAPSRYYQRPGSSSASSSSQAADAAAVASVASIRAQILNHIQNAVGLAAGVSQQPPNYQQPQELAPAVHYQVPSASSSAAFSRANLHQFLALNLMPVRSGGGNVSVGGNSSVVSQMLAAGNGNNNNGIVNSPPISPSILLPPPRPQSQTSQSSAPQSSQIVFHDTWDDTHHRLNLMQHSSSLNSFSQNSICNGQFQQLSSPSSPINDGLPPPPPPQLPQNLSPPHLIYFADGVYTTKPPLTAGGTALPTFIWRLKYSRSGAFLYAAGDGGSVRRYRQCPGQELRNLGDLFKHRGDVLDMDISPYDEYLVTASKDKTVGLLCLGAPNHGWTEYYELS